MSHVFAALDQRTGGEVAIKVLDADRSERPEARARFEREIALVATLQHPNTIRVTDCGTTDDGRPFLVMELLEGTALDDFAEAHAPIDPQRVVPLLRQVLRSLSQAHAAGVVHRDIKPANVFLVDAGQGEHLVKVLDFGISKAGGLGASGGAMTSTSTVMGSPLYMSPELCNGEPCNTKTDMWAAGVLMYEVCAKGRLPFAAGNQGAVINKILVGQYAPLSDSYSADVHGLVGECLSRDPRRRPTAEEVLGRLETLYQAHMKQEPPGAHQESTASGADHFTLASPNAGQRRAGSFGREWHCDRH